MNTYNNSFSYSVIKLLSGTTPIGFGIAMNTLIMAIEDPRVFVWHDENDNNITNIGALRFIHSTGEVFSIKKNRTVFCVPKNRIPVVLAAVNARIAKDRSRLRIRQLKESIKNRFYLKQK